MSAPAGISGSALDDHLSYSAMQGRGNQGHGERWVQLGNHYRSVNMGVTGGVVLHPQGVTLGQTLGSAVAIVTTPGANGVAVGNGSSRTNRWGQAVVPYLSNYQKNSISLDPSTLPDNVDITQSSLNTYPTKGAVVIANFDTRVGFQALVMLMQANHSPVPFGAIASLDGKLTSAEPNTGIVGDGGQTYLSGLPESGSLTVKWGPANDQQCRARFNLADSTSPETNPLRQIHATCEGAKS